MDSKQLFMLLQFTDGAFPTGGYVHSLGLEAYIQYFGREELRRDKNRLYSALISILENTASLNLPFVTSAYKTVSDKLQLKLKIPPSSQNVNSIPEIFGHDSMANHEDRNKLSQQVLQSTDLSIELGQIDKLCESFATNHTVRRASIRQGKALVEISLLLYSELHQDLLSAVTNLPHCHYPVIYGAILAGLGFDLETTLASFMFSAVRSLVTTTVKLDVIGTMEAQLLQFTIQKEIPGLVKRNSSIGDARVKFPLVDILQNIQDTFFTKLFYS